MLIFTDADDVAMPPEMRLEGVPGEVVGPFIIRFQTRPGFYLAATVSAGVTVEARKSGDSTWVDIAATPLDVTPLPSAPDEGDFEVRLTPAGEDVYDVEILLTETP